MPNNMDGKSLNISKDKLTKLKAHFPEVFSEDKVDWEKLKAALGEDVNFSNERYVLNWAGKSDAFRALQTPSTATLVPVREESVNFDDTNHIFIEGENLEVLKALQKSYYGKVKMIYIDPPYNTGNDHFVYPDKFSESKDEYLKRIGDRDEAGYMTREGLFRKNSKDSGHYHSNWLSMMYPRLFLAKNLLKDNGVIFVSIDDNEVHNLRLMMNEIFGEENFLATFVWKRRASSALAEKLVSTDHEYIIAFQKGSFGSFIGKEKDYSAYKNPDNDPRGLWTLGDLTVGMTKDQRPNQYYELVDPNTGQKYPANPNRVWGFIPETMDKLLKEKKVYFPKDVSKRPMFKRFKNNLKSEVNPISTWVIEVGMNAEATRDIQDIFGSAVFSYSKPLSLNSFLVKYSTKEDDIVLDFFAGSSPLAQAVLELNNQDNQKRRFMCVQLPEKTDEKSESFKFGFNTIADIGKERIRRIIKKIEKEQKEKKDLFTDDVQKSDLGFKVFKLRPSNFKIWRGDVFENGEELEKQLDAFVDPTSKDALEENMLFELLLKSGYNLNSKIEKKTYKKINYYSIENGELIIALSKINEPLVKEIISKNPLKVLCLDKLFTGNDQLKTNTALQMKDAGINLKTI